MSAPFLKVEGLTASYGASQALFGVDLNVDAGEVVALMGRNGMGKTTTIHAVCGLLPITGGSIMIDGSDTKRLPVHATARLGIGLVPEGRRCFPNLSVEENLVAAARSGAWTFEEVTKLFPRLAERRTQSASTLSGGEQQMLAIGRALMTNPRLLILDEATEGLAPVVRQEIWAAIHALKDGGLSILVVDKTIRELKAVADRCVILERGQSVWTGTPGELSDEVCGRYLGV
ncbi:MAG: ABC transporter ATP-binding protein [Rhodobiaceae bacterium]|nr:ABC transporter ATP-binding protein [Rhodobiaceae bacterium]MCC0051042.1 ABC transporter ATP-binding protein [Rhodobiaceae bacterium]MCC0060111.1 ABC transporter ATP-binding protein [Rhodobiaceae bacterium]